MRAGQGSRPRPIQVHAPGISLNAFVVVPSVTRPAYQAWQSTSSCLRSRLRQQVHLTSRPFSFSTPTFIVGSRYRPSRRSSFSCVSIPSSPPPRQPSPDGSSSSDSSASFTNTTTTSASTYGVTPMLLPTPPSTLLQRAANGMLALHVGAIALLALRALAAPAWNPILPPHLRTLCAALAIVAPELCRVSFDNIRACSVAMRRAERAERPMDTAKEVLGNDTTMTTSAMKSASTVTRGLPAAVVSHRRLTVFTTLLQLSGLYVATFSPTIGVLVAMGITSVYCLTRRLRFERLVRMYTVQPSEYRDLVIASSSAAFLALAVHMGLWQQFFAVVLLVWAAFYWLCKWFFVH